MTVQQVISKQRVADRGEVYTHPREVNAMLDLVRQETERIDSRFLEPACGTGNFLTEILRRKLRVAATRYRNSDIEFERNAVIAVSSLYGIDILQDNVLKCRQRLFEMFEEYYDSLFRQESLQTVQFLLARNIIWGDALTLKTADDDPQPIIFSEWSPLDRGMVVRRDFKFEHLVNSALFNEPNLFSDLGEKVFIPEPVREFPPTHYLKLADAKRQ